MSADVPIPHPYRPIAEAPQQPCAECFEVPTDPTFAEHHQSAGTAAPAEHEPTQTVEK